MNASTLGFLSIVIAGTLVAIVLLTGPRQPTYAGKPYDPSVRIELFNRCLDRVRGGANVDNNVKLCDIHSKQMAAELYAAGGAP